MALEKEAMTEEEGRNDMGGGKECHGKREGMAWEEEGMAWEEEGTAWDEEGMAWEKEGMHGMG